MHSAHEISDANQGVPGYPQRDLLRWWLRAQRAQADDSVSVVTLSAARVEYCYRLARRIVGNDHKAADQCVEDFFVWLDRHYRHLAASRLHGPWLSRLLCEYFIDESFDAADADHCRTAIRWRQRARAYRMLMEYD